VGHFPHCGDPARFARVLRAFAQDTPAAVVSSSRWREFLVPKSA
jgi:hypothetical protein